MLLCPGILSAAAAAAPRGLPAIPRPKAAAGIAGAERCQIKIKSYIHANIYYKKKLSL